MQIGNARGTVEVIVIKPILREGAWLFESRQTNALICLSLLRALRLACRRSSAEPPVPSAALRLAVQLDHIQHPLRDLTFWCIRHRVCLSSPPLV